MKATTLSCLSLLISLNLSGCKPRTTTDSSNPIEALTEQTDTTGFARALQPRVFSFPADEGPHPDFQTEWWYYTGNLNTETGRELGYQLTFFRRALAPETDKKTDDWPTQQIYFAHFTVSDIASQRFYAHERWQRQSIGLAGVQAEPFRVWLDHWQVSGDPEQGLSLQAAAEGLKIDLKLVSQKPVVLQGQQGLSQKSAGAGNASYYYSRSHLATTGTVTLPDSTQALSVQGLSWLDREWSTSVLSAEQTGWDWFSLHLDDGRELMLYQLRKADGSPDAFSSGTLIAADGTYQHLKAGDFQVEVLKHWTSPTSQRRYPAAWGLSIPTAHLKLNLEPLMADQELRLSFRYWEGAVKVSGDLSGRGYVELTGY